MDSGAYNLAFERREGYLYARVQADFMELDAAKKYLREIADRVESDGYEKVLIERDIPTMLGPGSLFLAAKAFAGYIGNATVAFVNVYKPIKADMDLAVLMGQNNGGRFTLHETVEQAEVWLRSR
jgi:hypothetical protein